MALEKQDATLEHVTFDFDSQGEVSKATLLVNYAIVDTATGKTLTRVRETQEIDPTERANGVPISVFGKFLKTRI